MTNRDADEKAAALAATQKALVTHAQARSAGLSDWAIKNRVRTGRWVRKGRRVYAIAGSPTTWEQEILAAVYAAGDGAVAWGVSAAALWKVPGFRRGPIEVTNRYGKGRRQLPDAKRQSCLLPAHHTTTIDGIPVTTVARTIFDLMAIIGAKKAERALDNALAMGLTSIAALERILEELGEHGRPGTALMRELMAERGEGYVATESELEARFLDVCRRHGLPIPRRQVTLVAGRVDFLLTPGAVVAELDGRRNHTALLDRETDAARDAKLIAQGLRVMRITWKRLTQHEDEVVADLRAALAAAAA